MIIARGVCELFYKLTAEFQNISLILLSRLKCNSMQFSRADSRVKTWSFSDVSGNNYVPILKMGMELVSETFDNLRHILMRLSAREKFIEFCLLANFKTCINSDDSQFGSVPSTLSWNLAGLN